VGLTDNKFPSTICTAEDETPALANESVAAARVIVVQIRSGKSNLALYLGDFWQYRELLYFLAWREVKVRYKQTMLGGTWALLQPLFTMLVFTLLFGRLARMPSDGIPYALFVYAGLVLWTYFSNAITGSTNSIVSNSSLVTKVYFPRLMIPMAAVFAGWIDLAISLVLLLAFTRYYGIVWTWRMAMIPALLLLTSLLATAVGSWMAAINVRYRDVRYALPFLVQAWMFLTPIIYPASLVPPNWRWLLFLNPLAGVMEAFRSALLGRDFDAGALLTSVAITLGILWYAVHSFRAMERSFADIV
jgi:lipopolysaccharide transport system permease protein